MNHLKEYEEHDVNDYIGKPIACDLLFKNKKDETYVLTIYDNKTYCITYPSERSYKRISAVDIASDQSELNRIDLDFKSWLITQLGKHYEL